MNALLDTDVVLDLVLARNPFVIEAAAIWLANEQGRFVAFIAPITPVNVFYITRRSRDVATARKAVRDLLASLNIAPLSQHDLHVAEALSMADFEDAVQVAAALAASCEAVVTRNGSDFMGAPLPIFTPEAFLDQLPALPSSEQTM